MNIIDIDFDKNKVVSDFNKEWEIVSNNDNKFLLLQRQEQGIYKAAEADVKKKHIWEVKEISYRAPQGEQFFLDENSGIKKL